MKVAIFGAGSVGCFVGGAWAAAGLPVSFVGRERIGREIAENGLTLTDYSGWRVRLAPEQVDFSTKPAALAEADIIALCVKSTGTAAAAKEIARNAKKGALVVSFQNGVSNVETLRSALKARFEAVAGMVPYNVAALGHGRFHKGVAGDLLAEDVPALRALAERIGDGPARLRPVDRHAGHRLGQIAHQPQQCGQRPVRPDPARAIEGARLSPGRRRLDPRGARACSRRPGSSRRRSARCRPGCSRTSSPRPISSSTTCS